MCLVCGLYVVKALGDRCLHRTQNRANYIFYWPQYIRKLIADFREPPAGEIIQEGKTRCIDALDSLDRCRCYATDAPAVRLVCGSHVVEVLGDRRLRCVHDGADDVADAREDRRRNLKSCAELLLEKVDDCVDRVSEPLALVVEQHQGRDEGHDADHDPGDGVRQERRRKAPHARYERSERSLR